VRNLGRDVGRGGVMLGLGSFRRVVGRGRMRER